MAQETHQPPYPVPCPKCGEVKGQPYDVRMSGTHVAVTVYLECDKCKHQWSVQGPTPADRRRR
jgi:DNA-directed RNA polymerase subunit M/transcription elongation factor TFIIS